jgi:hypothetical protein
MDLDAIPPDTRNHLANTSISLEQAADVFRKILRSETLEQETECHIGIVLSFIIGTNMKKREASRLLKALNFPKDFIEELESSWDRIEKPLTTVGFNRLSDVEWKSEHIIHAGSMRRIHIPSIDLALLVQGTDGNLGNISMTLTRDQLSSLVYSLKSAISQIDKYS